MHELTQGLTPAQLTAIAELETRAVRHDGGRLKLEWGVLRNRSKDRVDDILWWDGDQLLGFLGIYQFGSSMPELAGMVDPAARRQGIGSALLAAAFAAAAPIAAAIGCCWWSLVSHPEAPRWRQPTTWSSTTLNMRSRSPRPHPATTAEQAWNCVQATNDDIPELSRLFLDGFGSGEVDLDRPLKTERSSTLLASLDGEVIGTASTSLDGSRAGSMGS